MPPAVAVANETTSTPKRSSRCLTPAVAPLRAKTNVPTSSSTSSVPVVAYSLNPASVWRTCSAPNAGIIPGHGQRDGDDRDDDHQHVEQQRDRGCEPDVDIVGCPGQEVHPLVPPEFPSPPPPLIPVESR